MQITTFFEEKIELKSFNLISHLEYQNKMYQNNEKTGKEC